mgnify:CR=1 FL=1
MTKRILSLHAHPDDAEFLTGGTLGRLAWAGHEVIIASMTSGACGADVHPPAEIAQIRRGEGARAAAVIGAEYHSLGFSDLAIFVDDPARRRVTAALGRLRPDIVLTASPSDYHCDHEATSKLVTDAVFACSAPNYLTNDFDEAQALPALPHLYYVDPAEGLDRDGRVVLPQFLVDVTDQMETKKRMLACHESQRAWLQRQHGMDNFLETLEEWCGSRGKLAGVPFAEGFRQYTGHPYPRTPLLQELIGAARLRTPSA